jgi:hypothetical protein
MTLEQLHPEKGFQLLDLMADGGRGYPQFLRSPSEAAEPRGGLEGQQCL